MSLLFITFLFLSLGFNVIALPTNEIDALFQFQSSFGIEWYKPVPDMCGYFDRDNKSVAACGPDLKLQTLVLIGKTSLIDVPMPNIFDVFTSLTTLAIIQKSVVIPSSIYNHQTIEILNLSYLDSTSTMKVSCDHDLKGMKNLSQLYMLGFHGNLPLVNPLSFFYTQQYLFNQSYYSVKFAIQEDIFTDKLKTLGYAFGISELVNKNTIQMTPPLFANSPNLEAFTLATTDPPVNYYFNAFYNLPNLKALSIVFPGKNTTFPSFHEVNWYNLDHLNIYNNQFVGSMDKRFFTDLKLNYVVLAYNQNLNVDLTGIGKSPVKFLYTQKCKVNSIPETILDNGLMDLNVWDIDFSTTTYPKIFSCAPDELLKRNFNDDIDFLYAFNNPGYRNYITNSNFSDYKIGDKKVCVPLISTISEISNNNQYITITGNQIGPFTNYTYVTISNVVQTEPQFLSCNVTLPNKMIVCLNPFTLTGNLNITVTVNNSMNPLPRYSKTISHIAPVVNSISKAPTKGGAVTVTGDNLFVKIDSASSIAVGTPSVLIKSFRVLVPFKSFVFDMIPGIEGNQEVMVNVTGITSSPSTEPKLFFAPPLYYSTSGLEFNSSHILTIYGDNFWVDPSLVTVTIDSKPCILTGSDYSTIFCKTQTYPYNPVGLPIKIEVNNQTTTGTVLFIDKGICTNNCNQNGNCTINGCVCFKNFTGPGCQDQIIFIEHEVNQTRPDIKLGTKEIAGILSIVALRELDQNGKEVKYYPFKTWVFNNDTTDLYIYRTIADSTNITVTVQWFEVASNFTFGGDTIPVGSNTIKYSIELTKYDFQNRLNSLQLVMSAQISTSDSDPCSKNEVGTSSDTSSVQWVKLTVNSRSLYGRFIKTGIIDKRYQVLTNNLLDSQYNIIDNFESKGKESSTAQTLIGLNIPNYEELAYLDPDFSVLVSNDNLKCKNGLSVGQIVGIAVGGAVFLVAAAFVTVFLLKRKYKFFREGKSIKLVKINNN